MAFPFAEDQTVCDMKDDGTLYVNTHKMKGQRHVTRLSCRPVRPTLAVRRAELMWD